MSHPDADGDGDFVLVVVPCLNEQAHLPATLNSLLSEPGLAKALVVVADGGSTDGSLELVARAAAGDDRLRLLPNPQRIQSAGVNLAARTFGGGRRWLIRVDAHAEYPALYVTGLIKRARATGADAVVVPMVSRGSGCFQKAAAAAQNSWLGAGGSAHRRRGASRWVDHGHHALMRMEAFRAAGGYDESFSHNEDSELDLRLRGAGARIWLADELAIVYFPRRTPLALFRQYFHYGTGRARTLLKHRTPPRPRQLLTLGVAPAVLLLLAAPWAPAAAAPALLWAGFSASAGLGLALQTRDACAMLSGPAAMIMHLAWSLGFWKRLLGAPFD